MEAGRRHLVPIRAHAVERPATIAISGYAANDPTPISHGTTSIVISRDPVGAPIFFRDVPLMPSATEKGFIKPLANAAIPLINWSHAQRRRAQKSRRHDRPPLLR